MLQTPALNITSRMCSGGESGLLGIALDPDFGTAGHNYVYFYYTFRKAGVCPTDWNPANPNNPVNRVSRFVMSGDTIDPSSEEVLIDNIPSPTGNHNAGDLSFGKDGYLYVSVGDGQCDYAQNSGCQINNDASRDQNILLGKILRITRGGGIPATNPYTGTGSARCNITGRTDAGKKCQETFASGLRNPFRFAFDPDASGTRFFIGDVGNEVWDEVDQGKAGADYAWNLCEGNHDNPSRAGTVDCSAAPYTPPIYEYSHDTGCSAIVGAAFVPNGAWPAEYDDSYLYGDHVCNKIFELRPKSGGGFTQTEFASDLGQRGPVAMAFGPHEGGQALYYTTGFNGGEVRRITSTGDANRPPTAVVEANPTSGSCPSRSTSTPPVAPTLTRATHLPTCGTSATALRPRPPHHHDHPHLLHQGTYTASLRVEDNHGATLRPCNRAHRRWQPGTNPAIESPSADLLFRVGQQITLSGSATDPEDGQCHEGVLGVGGPQTPQRRPHPPVLSESGNDLTITAPMPEDLSSTGAGNYLEVRLTATDSDGLSKTVTREVQPNRVNVSFATNPSGLSLLINGQSFPLQRH